MRRIADRVLNSSSTWRGVRSEGLWSFEADTQLEQPKHFQQLQRVSTRPDENLTGPHDGQMSL